MRLLRLSTVVANTALTRGLAQLAGRGPLDDQPFVRAITKLVARSDYPAFAKWQAEADPLARRVLGDGAVSVAQFTRPTKDGETMRHDVVVAYRTSPRGLGLAAATPPPRHGRRASRPRCLVIPSPAGDRATFDAWMANEVRFFLLLRFFKCALGERRVAQARRGAQRTRRIASGDD